MRHTIVRHSNLGPILPRFKDIAGFVLRNWPHPYSTRILGIFPLDQIAHVGVSPSVSRALISRERVTLNNALDYRANGLLTLTLKLVR